MKWDGNHMRDYVLMTDSSCDLPAKKADELGLTVLPLSFTMEGKTYVNYLDEREMPIAQFYARLRSDATVVTAGVNFEAAMEAMEKVLKEGKDVLALGFSSALSCTYGSFASAAQELKDKYKDSKIYVVDTLSASLGQGLLVYLTAQEKLKGKTIDEVRDFAESTKLHLCHWFTVDDLHHLRRGGRISAATAMIGSMLSIKPIMHMDDQGRLVAVSKTRGRKRSILSLLDHMTETAIDPAKQTVFISHGDCLEDAQLLADHIRETLHVKDIMIAPVGPVIGAHSGPGTLALFFLGTNRN